MKRQYNLTPNQLDVKVTKTHLLARHITQWEKIAPCLGLTGPKIFAIQRDGYDQNNCKNLMLNRWIMENGSKATYQILITASLEAEETEFAESICKQLQDSHYDQQRSTLGDTPQVEEVDSPDGQGQYYVSCIL